MIRKKLSELSKEDIINFEESQMEYLKPIIDSLDKEFKKFDCYIEYEFCRLDKNSKPILEPIKSENLVRGYKSYISINIKKDGHLLSLDYDYGDDGILTLCEFIVWIGVGIFNTYVNMCTDYEEIIQDLKHYLGYVKKYGVIEAD
ncbi:hypothetical protein HAHI6034_11540 [Hathewaya histolytica]|uniref:Uncharacterized protein n=1 Tax=Hathewaya histolytica TaxID=1498 RepID=A0A4U9RAF5_HATHI|nr:hypothetical protein [Hathewaya histolytica]VTQ88106.1 Uncharacterised protein [Hathewaya histolytica]